MMGLLWRLNNFKLDFSPSLKEIFSDPAFEGIVRWKKKALKEISLN